MERAIATIAVVASGIIQPFGGIAVLLWTRWSGTPLAAIGYCAPRRPLLAIGAAIALGIGLKLVMKAIVLPLLSAPPTNAAYQGLVGNPALLPSLVFASIVAGGFGEETYWRGFLFERMGKLLGTGPAAILATISLTSLLFAAHHYFDQGLPGVEQAVFTGFVFGAMFLRMKTLWPVMAAHAAFDLTAVAIIYAGFEEPIAHLVFR
jgi:membrane protease YdiL (CAAX protease family)